MKLFDLRHPFFRPLWRRVAVTAVCVVWAVVELMGGNVFWAILFGGLGGLCAWEFFIVYDEVNYADREDRDGS